MSLIDFQNNVIAHIVLNPKSLNYFTNHDILLYFVL